eukprot:2390008-Amphidinium_carterae.3
MESCVSWKFRHSMFTQCSLTFPLVQGSSVFALLLSSVIALKNTTAVSSHRAKCHNGIRQNCDSKMRGHDQS